MPNLLSDNIGQILRGKVVQGEAQPDQMVTVSLDGQIVPGLSTNNESAKMLSDALTQLAALQAQVATINAKLQAHGIY
jgi:hypothetical protein